MLDFLAQDVGGVDRPEAEQNLSEVEDYVARKAVGNFVNMAGLATLHLSPLALLAVVSDVAYGSKAYVRELAEELENQGVIEEASSIHQIDDLLQAIADAAGTTASVFETPPLSVQGLKRAVDEVRTALEASAPIEVLPRWEMDRLWSDMRQMATREGVTPLTLSSAMTLGCLDKIGSGGPGALSTVVAASNLLDRHVFDHYAHALDDIRRKGIYACLAETSKPYIAAVWQNFSSERTTVTEAILSGEGVGRTCLAVRRWLGAAELDPAAGEITATSAGPPLVPSEPELAETPSEVESAVVEPRPAASSLPEHTAFDQVVASLLSASRFGHDRERLVREHANQQVDCTVTIERIDRTLGYVPEDCFHNGRTLTGTVTGTFCKVSLQLLAEHNQELESLGAGDTFSAKCTLLKWNAIYDRLDMQEVMPSNG
jgi:hypothetical protein